jgi:hypothetical protein
VSIWLSTDPLQEKDPNKTPYHYCSNNPIRYIDPTGLYDIENVKKGQESEVKTVAVFGKKDIESNSVMQKDYKAAVKSGVGILIVENVKDLANGLKGLQDQGVDPSVYTLNSHGNSGYFTIGTDQITAETITTTNKLTSLKDGFDGKTVFIGACNVTRGASQRGKSLIENISNQTNSTIISSDHYINAGYKYNGGKGLNGDVGKRGWFGNTFLGENHQNSYHIAKPGESAKQMYNFTINKNGKVTWDNGNTFNLPIMVPLSRRR